MISQSKKSIEDSETLIGSWRALKAGLEQAKSGPGAGPVRNRGAAGPAGGDIPKRKALAKKATPPASKTRKPQVSRGGIEKRLGAMNLRD